MSGRFCSPAKTARENKANRNGPDPCGVSRSFASLIMKKYLLIFGISALHYIVSILVIANGAANSINRMAVNYKPSVQTAFEQFLPRIIFFPGMLIKSTFSSDASLLIWTGFNSLLWGVAFYWIGGLILRRVRRAQ